VTWPKLVHEVKPRYTPEALQARIQGVVVMEAVVLTDGTVGDVTVVESLDPDHGLDDEGVHALTQWRFEPATRDGQPVAVLCRWRCRSGWNSSRSLLPPARHSRTRSGEVHRGQNNGRPCDAGAHHPTRRGLQWCVLCARTRSGRANSFTSTMPATKPPMWAQKATPPPSAPIVVNPPSSWMNPQ
jgi:TonB family protein